MKPTESPYKEKVNEPNQKQQMNSIFESSYKPKLDSEQVYGNSNIGDFDPNILHSVCMDDKKPGYAEIDENGKREKVGLEVSQEDIKVQEIIENRIGKGDIDRVKAELQMTGKSCDKLDNGP